MITQEVARMAILSLGRIKAVYERHQSSAAHIEFSRSDIGQQIVYSAKGTSMNQGKGGFWSLFRDIFSSLRVYPRLCIETGTRHPSGFLNAANRLVDKVCRDLSDKSRPVVMEGHSLGGAAVLIAADILLSRGYNIVMVMTFGSPKVGNLINLLKIERHIFKNGSDIVTTVPPFYGFPEPLTNLDSDSGGVLDDHALESYRLSIGRNTI